MMIVVHGDAASLPMRDLATQGALWQPGTNCDNMTGEEDDSNKVSTALSTHSLLRTIYTRFSQRPPRLSSSIVVVKSQQNDHL